jgi:hypothetical protein
MQGRILEGWSLVSGLLIGIGVHLCSSVAHSLFGSQG